MSSSSLSVVFDANVIVSASLNAQSTSATAFYQAIDEATILLSSPILREIRDVLRRDKFDRYVSRETRNRFLRGLVREADLVEPIRQIRACRDPDDDKYLALALHAKASCIVSGDNDLLVLDPFEGIPIMRPNEFLEWTGKDEN